MDELKREKLNYDMEQEMIANNKEEYSSEVKMIVSSDEETLIEFEKEVEEKLKELADYHGVSIDFLGVL